MGFIKLSRIHTILKLGILLLALSCSKDDSQFYYGVLDVQTPKLIIASNQAGSTALVMYDLQGNLIRVVQDYSSGVLSPRGLVALGPLDFFVSLDGNDHIERISLVDGVTETIADNNFAGNVFQMRRHPQYGNFVIETATIESFTDDGSRIGNPRISAAVGTCTLVTPRGMAITSQGYLAVVDTGNDDLLIYDVSQATSTTCVRANTTFGNIDPTAVLAHSDGYLYVATQGDDRIYRFNGDGSGAATVVYNNILYINNPSAMVEMPDGTILVASDGTNNVVRIRTDGTYVGSTPFIFDVYSNSISDMIILEETSP